MLIFLHSGDPGGLAVLKIDDAGVRNPESANHNNGRTGKPRSPPRGRLPLT